MNSALAQMYGTGGAEASEEQEKLANLELFAKLAAQHNVDLSSMTDAQVQELYAQTFDTGMPKIASDDEDEDDKGGDKDKVEAKNEDDEDEKKASAAAYLQEKVAFQEKFAEADLMGRVMAHAFVQERDEIEKAAMRGETTMTEAVANKIKKGGGTVPPEVKIKPGAVTKLKGFAKTKPGKAVGAALGVGALAGGGYAAYKGLKGKGKEQEKKSSAAQFEELAAEQAIKIASAAGFDGDEALNLVNAAYTLGLAETEKLASVQNVDDALHIRGLEYLEAVGYPVDWSEIYGE